MTVKEFCHVCGREKKPYVVIMDWNPLNYASYLVARENGPICERCHDYYGLTGEFKDASEEEFEIAKKASEFARLMLAWWEKDEKLEADMDYIVNCRDWPGTHELKKWCREHLTKKHKTVTARDKDGRKTKEIKF